MNNVRLKNIITYAYEKVPFYINKDIDKKIFEDENTLNILRQLPVVDKEDIIKSDNNNQQNMQLIVNRILHMHIPLVLLENVWI